MNCTDYRNHLVAAPGASAPAMDAHRETCAACAEFAQQLQAMDRVLEQAMHVDVPDNLGQTVLLQKIAQRRRRALGVYAVAASLLVGVGLAAGLLFGGRADNAMHTALVAHVVHELSLLEPTTAVVPVERVSNVLQQGKVLLDGDIGTVRHAGLCEFRGNLVPHLVVNTATGPVTVMLLPNEKVDAPATFEEDGFNGVVVPAGRGSIAIIGDEPTELEPVRKQFSRAVEYSI